MATTPDVLTVKAVGEGSAATTADPFASFRLPSFSTPDAFEALRKPQVDGPKAQAQQLIDVAKKYVGTPYKWGGTGPTGFDCSGFTQYVFHQFGIDLPRISYQQANYGKHIAIADAKPGDLVAWDLNDRNQGADHIGIYLGNGMVIHAPKPGDAVKISKVWGTPWAVSMNL